MRYHLALIWAHILALTPRYFLWQIVTVQTFVHGDRMAYVVILFNWQRTDAYHWRHVLGDVALVPRSG